MLEVTAHTSPLCTVFFRNEEHTRAAGYTGVESLKSVITGSHLRGCESQDVSIDNNEKDSQQFSQWVQI